MANVGYAGSADKTITVQEFIAIRTTDDVTYYNYSIIEYLHGFDMFITNLLYDYEDELQDISTTIALNAREKAKYKYKPWLFAYDVYGSTESQFLVMMMNGIIDPKEFDFDKVKVIDPSQLSTILNRIQAVNEDYINNNRNKLKIDFKNNDGNEVWNV